MEQNQPPHDHQTPHHPSYPPHMAYPPVYPPNYPPVIAAHMLSNLSATSVPNTMMAMNELLAGGDYSPYDQDYAYDTRGALSPDILGVPGAAAWLHAMQGQMGGLSAEHQLRTMNYMRAESQLAAQATQFGGYHHAPPEGASQDNEQARIVEQFQKMQVAQAEQQAQLVRAQQAQMTSIRAEQERITRLMSSRTAQQDDESMPMTSRSSNYSLALANQLRSLAAWQAGGQAIHPPHPGDPRWAVQPGAYVTSSYLPGHPQHVWGVYGPDMSG